jgi:hypothetical protein
MNRQLLLFLFVLLLIAIACSKNGGGSSTITPTNPVTPVTPVISTCIISGISQRNSGTLAEFGLTASYDNNLNPLTIRVYDSLNNLVLFSASFTYATADSVRIDSIQYLILDANKRVTTFVTKSDLTNPATADNYRYQYIYNGNGYLATKNLYINGSGKAYYSSAYTYTNNLLTGCVMTSPASGNQTILSSSLSYDTSTSPKTMIYPFPDGFENYYYSSILNYGNRPAKVLSQVVTKLYNPGTGALLDTWTTNYSGYTLDGNGYLSYGIASGDLQQGMASFYGKTYFYYQCK